MVDATYCSEESLRRACALFGIVEPLSFSKAVGGVNNRVYLVHTQTRSLCLRVYNNGGNVDRVVYEHRILQLLGEKTKGKSFPIQLHPVLLMAPSGESFVNLVTPTETCQACLFEVIPGRIADISSPSIATTAGEATALLMQVMALLPPLDMPCPNPKFREVFQACPGTLIERDCLDAVMSGFTDVLEDAKYLMRELDRVVAACAKLELPEQLIHADLHLDNFLCLEGRVTGILDFEFSAYDWRVQEVAVGMTKYVASDGIDINMLLLLWMEGFVSAGGILTEDEIAWLPDGMVLRILSNVVFFCGRAQLKQDSLETLAKKIVPYAKRCRWVEANRNWLVKEFRMKLKFL